MSLAFRLDLRDPGAHRIGVELQAARSCWPDQHQLELFLPVWTPGSYMVREYQRHIENFAATDAVTGKAIEWRKTSKNRYRLAPTPAVRALRLRYDVFAHELSVRTADVTEDHAFWNGACVFLWPVGAPQLDATIDVRLPEGWTLHTSLPTITGGVRHARDLDELMDMPCVAGTPIVIAFEVLGKPHEFVLDGLAGIRPRDKLVHDTSRIVEAAAAVFGGELPYASYRFLALFSDAGQGGLEHRDSTVLLAPRTTFHDDKSYASFMGLVAHEFFHVWNAKRMRPVELWTIDYERENHTSLLWVAEGFTAYFDDLLCRRAGVISRDQYLEILAEHIAGLTRNPGRLIHSLAEASYDAWIRLYRPDENSRNSSQSYYTNGALAALCLDLHIRKQTAGARSLDHVVRALYAMTFAAGRGYTEEDVRMCLAQVAGRDTNALLTALVHGPFDPDFDALFVAFGLRLVRSVRAGLHLGVQFQTDTLQIHSVMRDSPAMRGGLAAGDEILGIADLRVRASDFQSIFAQVARADTPIEFLVCRRGLLHRRAVTPTPQPCTVTHFEVVADASDDQVALRRGWLGE